MPPDPDYDFIRDKIVQGTVVDGPGAKGPKGSFNHKGGKELVIEYKTQCPAPNPSDPPIEVKEVHHIVPYLIGIARTKDDEDGDGDKEKVLLAWKYVGAAPTSKKGFRCYKVENINLPSPQPPTTRPPLSTDPQNDPPDVRRKLKLKRQSCVDDW